MDKNSKKKVNNYSKQKVNNDSEQKVNNDSKQKINNNLDNNFYDNFSNNSDNNLNNNLNNDFDNDFGNNFYNNFSNNLNNNSDNNFYDNFSNNFSNNFNNNLNKNFNNNLNKKKASKYSKGGYYTKEQNNIPYQSPPIYYTPNIYPLIYNNFYNTPNSQLNNYSEDFNKHNKNHFNNFVNSSEFILEKNQNKNKNNFEYLLLDIETIEDLIELGLSYGIKYSKEKSYNINLKMISELVEPLQDLNKLIGLKNIKKQIVDLILFYSLNLDDHNNDLLHTVIEGEPGTGKTELALALSKVYLKMGILTKNIFIKVRVSDLKGEYLGHSAAKTQEILESCLGGVLFIDEAYSLGNSDGKNSKDVYSKEIIDLINQWLTEHKNDFICIIAGYKEDLKSSFFSFNDGLERRFPIRFSIDGYDSNELKQIFIKKVIENGWTINENAITDKVIENHKQYFKFNGGDMEVLFAKCKLAHAKNLLKIKDKYKKVIDEKDVMEGIKIFIDNPNIKERNNTSNIEINMYV